MNNINFLDKYSNASKLFGMEVTSTNPILGELEANFDAKDIFKNTEGNIQGGILTAMLGRGCLTSHTGLSLQIALLIHCIDKQTFS